MTVAALPDGFVALRRNVGIFNGRGGTIGWYATPDALAIVDTQFSDTAAICLAGLPKLTVPPSAPGRQIDVVINTHHHADHTSGNPVLRPSAEMIVAHANVPALQKAAAARMDPPTVDKQVYADTLFKESWEFSLPGPDESTAEVIHAGYFGPSHTGGDIVVTFQRANVVHMGDLVFNRIYPVIDRPGGANIAHWINALETIARTYPQDAIYVFGHGNPKNGVVGKRSDLLIMRDYLGGLLAYVRRQITAGKSRAEIVTLENLPGFDDYHQPLPNRLGGNLAAAYDELTAA